MTGVVPKVRVRQLGSYVLGRRIGSGGMASVFAARQLGAGVRGATRVVAVKVMATALADDPAARRMFEREAVIATRVEHPNVVRTYEVGEVNGEIFLAMELVRGAALSTLCAYAPGVVPMPIAVRIACDVARGLSAVHDLRDANGELLRVVHQDVTPHNVIVGYDGVPKLLDFGIARMVAQDGSHTQSIRGKPAYLAPEQVALARVDCRADIYGLGAVLFELLTGTRSSRASEAAAPRAEVDVRSLRADVPEPLARVVAKALATDPDERFATAEEMRRALTDARDASGLPKLEESDIAHWVRAVAPPSSSLADLERELSLEDASYAAYHTELAAVAELPTIAEGPRSSRARRSRRARRWPALVAGSLAMIAAIGGWRYATRAPRSAPGLKLLSSMAGQAASTAGVHLLITLDKADSSAWAGIFFDHITVTATSGSQIAVVCLTPRAEGQRAFAAPAPSPSDPDPCADLHNGGFAGVNGVYPPSTFNDDWDLATNPWELDFDGLSSGDSVSIQAKAIFGGAAAMEAPVGVMTAQGSAVATASFPGIELAFVAPPDNSFWGREGARCDQGNEIASWLEISTFPSQPNHPVACPRTAKGLAFTPALQSVPTPTLGTVGRIPAIAKSGCGEALGEGTDGVVLWKSDLVPLKSGCVTLRLTGRFARCASDDPGDGGSCVTSVRCAPPPTDLVALSSDGRVLKSVNISCVPSYPEPVQYSMTFEDPGAGAGAVALGLRRGPSGAAGGGGCFFDLYDFSAQAGCGR
jgi:serine/threonine protein kinase